MNQNILGLIEGFWILNYRWSLRWHIESQRVSTKEWPWCSSTSRVGCWVTTCRWVCTFLQNTDFNRFGWMCCSGYWNHSLCFGVKDPCSPDVCGQGSTCQPRAEQEFVCLCVAGEYYNYERRRCDPGKSSLAAVLWCSELKKGSGVFPLGTGNLFFKCCYFQKHRDNIHSNVFIFIAKVFPGTIGFPTGTYSDKMADTSSQEFKNMAKKIIEHVRKHWFLLTFWSAHHQKDVIWSRFRLAWSDSRCGCNSRITWMRRIKPPGEHDSRIHRRFTSPSLDPVEQHHRTIQVDQSHWETTITQMITTQGLCILAKRQSNANKWPKLQNLRQANFWGCYSYKIHSLSG